MEPSQTPQVTIFHAATDAKSRTCVICAESIAPGIQFHQGTGLLLCGDCFHTYTSGPERIGDITSPGIRSLVKLKREVEVDKRTRDHDSAKMLKLAGAAVLAFLIIGAAVALIRAVL